ncbi:MOP flippase family protein [Nitrosophilus kaiyonis]|uniref:MOP flippase family protein n=1 Tax=Nitrosophilus kaiyonis TaxID=2930200 RepID=UPI002492779D|nr:MOP flippase family protein [Nitrosophilus kaiyonis]
MKRKTIIGLKWTSLSSIFSAGISFLQLIILARILGPQVYGTMAILMVIIGFANLFIDLGISRIIIYKQNDITITQLYSMYWMNIFLAVFVYIIIFFSAPLIAKFYNHMNDLSFYIRLISISFVINAISMQHIVLFQKDMEFKILEIANIIRVSLNFIIALFLALNNMGVLSLIYALLFSNIIYSFIIVNKGRKYHKIKFYFNFNEIKEAIKFGLYFSGSKILGAITSSIDVLIIGKFFSQEELGVYDIAKKLVFQILSIIMSVIQKVIYPLFGKLQQNPKKLKHIYIKIISLISFILVPIYSLFFLLSNDIFMVILGEYWIKAADIVKGFYFYVIFVGIGTTVGSLMTATGKVNIGLFWNIYNLFIVFIVVFITVVNFYKIEYIPIAYSLITFLNIFIYFYFVIIKIINVSFFEYYKHIFINFTIGIFLIIIFIHLDIKLVNIYLELLLKALFFLISYIVLVLIFNRKNLLYLMELK